MSLFGTSPPGDAGLARGRSSLFDDDDDDVNKSITRKPTTEGLLNNDGFSTGAESPWNMPLPRKQQSRADILRNLLPTAEVPDTYVDVFENIVREDGIGGRIEAAGITRTIAAANLSSEDESRIMSIVAPNGASSFSQGEFNVLLALIALAQHDERISLDSIDEQRRNLPEPRLQFLSSTNSSAPSLGISNRSELAAKPPQRPINSTEPYKLPSSTMRAARNSSMDYSHSDDPWNAPDLHRDHHHTNESHTVANRPVKENGTSAPAPRRTPEVSSHPNTTNGESFLGDSFMTSSSLQPPIGTTSDITTTSEFTQPSANMGSNDTTGRQNMVSGNSGGQGGWGGYYEGGFGEGMANPNPFGGPSGASGVSGTSGGGRDRAGSNVPTPSARTLGSGRTGATIEENVSVTLLPEKEGMFLFQHHNYEVTSIRRGSKVIRRYSDFVWLLDCLHKRYPFRALPLLPPKRVAVNGNHLSNDGAFIEKRRRGLARFLNALVRHPILREEQLVIMFLTVPTELAVWRKQATISVQDEFQGRELPAGLEESLPLALEDLFDRTRLGVRRSAELYIGVCNIMDRLVKRNEGVAADHARIALSLISLTELSNETYATDSSDVPLLNDGLVSMAKHLRTTQGLMEDESRAWDQGVLEDLKRQRDALVSVRDMFERRERNDRNNIPQLERRISKNEIKLADLRAKPEGMVKPGEAEKVASAIVADRQSIIEQRNRSVFIRECIRDELVFFQTTQYHVSRWNQDWAQERVKYAEMLADNWRRLLDELEGMPLGN